MADVSISIDDHSPEFLQALEQQGLIALEECGLVAEGYAKRLCPVDTGRLRNSITHARKGMAEYIGTNVEYAAYVEMGTSRTRAQPYIKPSVADHVDEYVYIIKRALQG